MKKLAAVILLFDLMAGLLFLGVWEEERFTVAETAGDAVADADAGGYGSMEAAGRADEDAKKIALTFDDGVIVGLSQELLV
ncbi:MAG: hypothetical protein J1E01_05075 [Acetatifactor sp.]|nr:hypothetical protein [Acetatifactor sp.]